MKDFLKYKSHTVTTGPVKIRNVGFFEKTDIGKYVIFISYKKVF